MGGLLIEHGEAEGLIAELEAHLTHPDADEEAPVPEDDAAEKRRTIRQHADAAAAHGDFLPLRHAARVFELTDAEYDALLLAIAVEDDARFGRLIAYLNDHVGRARPTIGLASTLALLNGEPDMTPVALDTRPILRDGLLELEGEGPLPGMSLVVPRDLLPRLCGIESASPELILRPVDRKLWPRLILEEDTRRTLAAWVDSYRKGQRVPPIVFEGIDGSGRSTLAHAVASQAGHPLISVPLHADQIARSMRVARREARWHDAVALLRITDASPFDAAQVWRDTQALRYPAFFSVPRGIASQLAAAAPTPPLIVRLAKTDAGTRLQLWRALVPSSSGISDEALADVAAKFRMGPRGITHAVQRALAASALAPKGRQGLTQEVLEAAARESAATSIGSLAQKLPLPYTREELVVPEDVATELDLAIAWIKHEQQVLDRWGFRRRVTLGRGLTALFAGPPGTGKTMAAQVLARELGLDLYRVDLSRVMSKYIGDTEKALAQLFDHGESCVLFFDEADALFGKRSEVKDAHDRYANVEIGYLLQRLEEHDGVTVLSSNRARDMDEAFVRRFQVIINFPMPSEPDRLRIWDGMFPPAARSETTLDLPAVARDFELSGGEIKNAALAAAYLAAAEHRGITMQHLRTAIRREIVKAGRVPPAPS